MENKDLINLIPPHKNPSPDYYCTWQTQLYATSGGTPAEQRRIINEHYIFNTDFPCGWAYFYEKARDDLYFVMDDSWDVPETDYQKYYGCLFPDSGKFPEATRGNDSTEALASLTERIKSIGWKGLGGWVCAQESEIFKTGSTEDYWISRLKAAQKAGFSYWKVDWGKKASDAEFRKALSRLARIYAPELTLENAMLEEVIPYSDAFRTYDVPALMSIPMTMEKIQFYAGAVRERGGYYRTCKYKERKPYRAGQTDFRDRQDRAARGRHLRTRNSNNCKALIRKMPQVISLTCGRFLSVFINISEFRRRNSRLLPEFAAEITVVAEPA